MVTPGLGDKRMRLRFEGTCRCCGMAVPQGVLAVYERERKTVRCLACDESRSQARVAVHVTGPPLTMVSTTPAAPESGDAGSSARREYLRRKAHDEQAIRTRWGRLGGIAVALSDEKQTTTAWQRGAVGEERLGARLDGLVGDRLVALHDRRIPGSRANIDHLVVTGAGVWVIDAKRYRGRPMLKVEGGILRPRVEKLMVGGRDATKTVDGVHKQISLVSAVVHVPVHGVLCFVDADWPLVGGSFTVRGVRVLWPRLLAKVLTDNGTRQGQAAPPIRDTASILATRFPVA